MEAMRFESGQPVQFAWEGVTHAGVVDTYQRLSGWVFVKEASVPGHRLVAVRQTDVWPLGACHEGPQPTGVVAKPLPAAAVEGEPTPQ